MYLTILEAEGVYLGKCWNINQAENDWGKGDLDWANLNLHKPVKNVSYCPMYYPPMINVNWKYIIVCDIHACCKSIKNKPYMIYLY